MKYLTEIQNEKTSFIIIGKEVGFNKSLHLHNVRDGKVCEEVPFSKEAAQGIFSIFSKNSYSLKSFQNLIPKNVLVASDDAKLGVKLAWSLAPQIKKLKFSINGKVCNLLSGEYHIPRLIFILKKSILYVYSVKDENITENTILYLAPFYNVFEDGSVCMGNVSMKPTKSFEYFENVIQYIENAFFNSLFTHSNNNKITEEYILQFKKTNNTLFPLSNQTEQHITLGSFLTLSNN